MNTRLLLLILLILELNIQAQITDSCEFDPDFITYVHLDLIPCALTAKINKPVTGKPRVFWWDGYQQNNELVGTFGYSVKRIKSLSSVDPAEIYNETALRLETESYAELSQLEFSKFKNLAFLDLVSYNLDSIPKEIWHIKTLKFLKISCKRNQKIPDDIALLTKLETLILDNNDNLKYLSPKIFTLKNLQRLEISRTHSTRIGSLHLINGLSGLKYLSLKDNYKNPIEDIDFKNLNNLEFLEIHKFHPSISGLPKLRCLYIDLPVSYEQATIISSNRQIEELILEVNDCKTLDALTALPDLEMISLVLHFSFQDVAMTKQFNDLRYVNLHLYGGAPSKLEQSMFSGFKKIFYFNISTGKNLVTFDKELLSKKSMSYFTLRGKTDLPEGISRIGTTKVKIF